MRWVRMARFLRYWPMYAKWHGAPETQCWHLLVHYVNAAFALDAHGDAVCLAALGQALALAHRAITTSISSGVSLRCWYVSV